MIDRKGMDRDEFFGFGKGAVFGTLLSEGYDRRGKIAGDLGGGKSSAHGVQQATAKGLRGEERGGTQEAGIGMSIYL